MINTAVAREQMTVPTPWTDRAHALREAGLAPCVQALLALDGGLAPRKLRDAVAQVVARHAILHGSTWTISDVHALAAGSRPEVRERRLRDERRALVEPARQPVSVRAHLLSWTPRSHDLLLTLDGGAADAGTLSALAAEVMTAYAGAPRANEALSFAEVLNWWRTLAQDEGDERGRLFWELHGRQRDADRPSSIDAGAVATPHASEFVDVDGAGGACAAAERAADRLGCSLPGYLLACWQALIWRLDGVWPLTGVTVPARNYDEFAGVVGPLDVTVPLGSRARGEMTLAAFARTVDRAWRGAVEWLAYYDAETVGVAAGHVYEIGFAHVAWRSGWNHGALRAALTHPRVDVTGSRLALTVCETGEGGALSIQFDPRSRTRAAVRRISRAFAAFVADAAARPHATIDGLQLLSAAERDRIVRAWNGTERLPASAEIDVLPRQVEAQAVRTPDAVAIASAHGAVTYAALNAQANHIAQWVRAQQLGTGAVVAISVGRKPALVAAVLGMLKSGAAYLPLDASYPDDRLRLMMADANVRALITERDGALGLRQAALPVYEVDGPSAFERTAPADDLPDAPHPDRPAYVIYTSGSTGAPKGVVITHRNLAQYCLAIHDAVGCTAADTVVALTTLSFDIAVQELLYPLAHGARVLMLEDRSQWSGASSLFALARHDAPTILQCTPTLARMLAGDDDLAPVLRGLRLWLVGGEALPASLAPMLRERCGGRVLNVYGPTETTVWALVHDVTAAPPAGIVAIGRPLANTQAYVCDSRGELMPIGSAGELWIGGGQVGQGYMGRPDLTATRFVPDAIGGTPGARMYRTGDLARWRGDGELEFIGRVDTQVKVRGFRVELGEIEATLRRDPRVEDAAVALHGGASSDDRRLVGYVVPRGDDAERAGLQEAQIDTWQRVYEATYAANPAAADFNLAGWMSSYTGEPIPAAEMRIWVEETVSQLRALAPQDVLEVGCGTGLLLTRVAPRCTRYIGIDFAPSALAQVGAYVAQRPELQHVELRQGLAHELGFLADDSVDLVILNSVAQYFPDVDYLLEVLREAVRVTRPGGRVWVGDVRSLPLLEAYHTSVQLHRASDDVTAEELRARTRRAFRSEQELVVAPTLFEEIAQRWPKVGRADAAVKGGAYDNEMSRFRYDVTLHIGAKQTRVAPTQWVMWDDAGQWQVEVERRLRMDRPAAVGIRGVRDRRVAAAIDAQRRLQAAPGDMTARQMRAEWIAAAAEDPDAVVQWARRHGIALGWTRFDADGVYDVLIDPTWTPATGVAEPLALAAYRRFGNAPARIAREAALALDLQKTLRRSLPDYMVPAHIVVLDAFPLLPSGKVDRKRLPAPDDPRTLTRGYAAPRTAAGEIVAAIWADVLHLPRVGANDHFLAIGGDSLNAVQVLVRLRQAFGREITLRTLFEHTTPDALAQVLVGGDGESAGDPPIERIARDRPLPASFGQERLWVVDRVTGSQAYRVSLAAEVTGTIDPRALAAAVTALATRHEVLRTTIGVVDGRPVQEIAPPAAMPVRWIDLGGLSLAARTRAADAVLRALESSPFDLQAGPLWCVTIVRLDPGTHILTCMLHHIVADGWSVGVLLRDLGALYEAARTKRPARLPDLAVQYADYAAWQRRVLTPERQAEELAYWRTQLTDVAALALPTDRPRGPLPGLHGGAVARQWDAAFTRDMQGWTRAQSATTFMVLLAGWQALLARYAGQQDVAVGTPIAQRPKQELEPLIGFFLNTLVMRTPVDSATSWEALVADVRARALAAYAHQTVPFERIIDELQPQRDLARTPFFQVMFVFQNNPQTAIELGDLQLTPLDGRAQVAMFDLLLEATVQPDSIAWLLHYDARLFDRSTAEAMLRHLEALVRAALAAPQAPIGTLSLLSEAERRHMYADDRFPLADRWLATSRDWTIDQRIIDRFHHVVTRHPSRIAVKTPQTSSTYRELNRRANRVAHALATAVRGRAPRRAGDGHCGRVALLFGHDGSMLAGILGVLKTGHAYVPLDPNAPLARLRQVWSDAEPVTLLADAAHAVLASEIAAGAPVVVVDDAPDAAALRAPKIARVLPDAPAYILYTSGSTGEPKGVVQSQRNVLHFIRTYTANLRLAPDDRLTLLPGYGFDAAVMDIFGALLNGAALYPFSLRDGSPQELADWIDRERITVLHATPTVFRTLMSSVEPDRVFASVRLVVIGGEAAWRSDAEQFIRHFARGCVLVNGLGPTESTVTLQGFVSHDDRLTRAALPVGYPVDETRIRLLDAHGYDAEVFGQLAIDSRHVALGYWRRDDLTRAAFESGDGGRRTYRTGDLARRLPDGSLEFIGRADQQVKIRGYRVELSEVEIALAGHPAIRECAVALTTNARGGERLVAYIVPRAGGVPPARGLRQFVATRLPDPMVPSQYITVDALPLRANGKVDRDALPAPPLDPASAEYVAPRDAAEQQLADLWRDALGVDRVGVNDNFFELGGDSITAIKITGQLRAVGIETTPWLLFQYQTIADLAPALAGASAAAADRADAGGEPDDTAFAMSEDHLAHLASRVEFEIS